MMYKSQKRQLLCLTDILYEANIEIKKMLDMNDQNSALQLLENTQNCAYKMGTFIEKNVDAKNSTVKLLEEYCELLYQISTCANDSEQYSTILHQLKAQVHNIKRAVAALPASKLEVVFMPYKASMWDSLESVWKAACEDNECDVYVVPIPYYNLLPNGQKDSMQYEGNKFPEYVPVTSWKEYSLQERHPDIIFIHNPYDGTNFVTRVDERFFCKELRKYTDLLVYIPYFVCSGYLPKHFCVLPGTIYSSIVIAQSESIRKTYIDEFRKFERQNNCVGAFGASTKKFLALGSPKFDKVIQTKREDCRVPDDWRRLIEDSDGTKKKVLLYNTSIAELLQGNENMLNKIQRVFKVFKNRKDVVLLWRPHPLNEATCESMRPDLMKKYVALVDEYKREAFGIYDDTPDLNRAIAISDAYYGSPSSLVALYQCTGKPIMLQNIDITETEEKRYLIFEAMYDDGSFLWFSAYDFNGLFRMKKGSFKAEYMGSFPNEKKFGYRLYASITGCNGKLYFAPSSAKEGAEYDIENHTFRKIKIVHKSTEFSYVPAAKFYGSINYKHWVFFISCTYPAFVRYDTITGKLDYFSDWVKPIEKLVTEPNDVYFSQNPCVLESSFFISSCNANAVVEFDMEHCKSVVHKVGHTGCCYCGICFDGNNFWMPPRKNGPIVKWNYKTGEYKELSDFPDGFLFGHGCSFWNINYAGGNIYIFPISANMALKIDPSNDNISVAEKFQEECKTAIGAMAENYILSLHYGDILYAYAGKSNKFIYYDMKTKGYKEDKIIIPEGTVITKESTKLDDILHEDAIGLQNYLDAVCKGGIVSSINSDIIYSDGTAGLHIYNECKKHLKLK